MPLTPGTRLGPYEILSAIGAGGMGEVSKARDTRLDRTVAIKILPEAFAADADRVARFQREAKTLAALNHPNIAQIFGLEQAGDVHALAMEFVAGDDLSDRIARGPIPLDEALPITKQIADALEAAHDQGIIHRDLKPANIKITPNGIVKVLDFGLAKALGPIATSNTQVTNSPTLSMHATQAGIILGTAAYMSPEQARGKTVDRRADIWAFGVVVFEMLSGSSVFHGETITDVLAAVVTREPDWTALPASTPTRLRELLIRCLRKDPRARIQAIGDARVQLEELLSGQTDAVAPVSRETRGRFARIVSVASLLVALGAASTAVIVWRRPVAAWPLTQLELSTPPTTDPFSFALSPDGRQIAYVADADGGSKLWLRSLDQTTAQPLEGTDGAILPFWAPDGHALGFFDDTKLKRIDLGGGAPQVLAVVTSARGATWNRDGVLVFSPGASGLMQIAAPGRTPTPLTRLVAGQNSHRIPQFLPDGRHFLFFVQGPPDTQGVYLGSLEGGEPTRILATDSAAAYAAPGYLLWVSQGTLIARRFDSTRGVVSDDPISLASRVGVDNAGNRPAFSVSTTGVLAHRTGVVGRRQLVWVDRTGEPQGTLGPPEDDALSYVELSPDDQQVATHRVAKGTDDVWLIEADRGRSTLFTTNPAIDTSPIWSPDGRHVAFRSSRNGGTFDLVVKEVNSGAEESVLLRTPQNKAPQSWSSNGFLLYSVQGPKGQSALWAMPMKGEGKPFPVVQSSFDEIQGQFSPDGRWVAYSSNESGHYEVYACPFPACGAKVLVSTGGGITPRWRHDGKEIFYVAPDNRMMAVPIQISANGQQPITGAPIALFASHLTTGNVGVGGYASRPQYAVAVDGRFLLNVSSDATASSITIVQNWPALLKQ